MLRRLIYTYVFVGCCNSAIFSFRLLRATAEGGASWLPDLHLSARNKELAIRLAVNFRGKNSWQWGTNAPVPSSEIVRQQ